MNATNVRNQKQTSSGKYQQKTGTQSRELKSTKMSSGSYKCRQQEVVKTMVETDISSKKLLMITQQSREWGTQEKLQTQA
jgi:hypothetical protein